jgi:hypothetical protein
LLVTATFKALAEWWGCCNALIALVILTTGVSAQSTTRSFYDSSGRGLGRAMTSGGVITTHDASGRVTSREYTSGNATTVYDAGGHNIDRFTTSPAENAEVKAASRPGKSPK